MFYKDNYVIPYILNTPLSVSWEWLKQIDIDYSKRITLQHLWISDTAGKLNTVE